MHESISQIRRNTIFVFLRSEGPKIRPKKLEPYRGTSAHKDSSEVDSDVMEELRRQGRQWRADERARAREGERRARELADAAAKQAELARKKSARKSPERVRVKRTPRMDVRAGHERVVGQQRDDSESGWELGRKSKRKEKKDKARARVYRDTEEESSASSSDDSAWVRRRRYDSWRRDEKKTKTRGRDRLAATSSESESERDVRGSRSYRVEDDGDRAGKTLRSWNLKFNGRVAKKAAEEFMHQLDDCREGNQLSDAGMLGALPCVFTGEAATWFRLEKARISSWKALVKAFKRRFIGEYDRQDVLDDLRRRTQGKGESVEGYIENFRLIVSHFRRPPSEESQVDRAYRNLLPEYRRAMNDEVIESLDDIVKYGRRFERRKEIDGRYAPPPPAEKMHIQSAAFTAPPSAAKARVAAAGEESALVEVTKPKRKGKKRDEKGSASDTSVSAAEVMGMQQLPTKTNAVRNGQTYGEATRENGRSGGNAYAPGTVPPACQPDGNCV